MLHYAVGDDVAGMYDVLVVCFKVDLVDEAFAAEGKESAAGDERVTPLGETLALISDMRLNHLGEGWCVDYHLNVHARFKTEIVTCPCKQSVSLCDHPIQPSV